MTSVTETRYTDSGTPYQVVVPVKNSTTGFRRHAADVVREHLYREGLNFDALTDDQLLAIIVSTFRAGGRQLQT